MLCLLCEVEGDKRETNLSRAHKKFLEYQDNERDFQKGVESQLVKSLIDHTQQRNLAGVDAAIVKYYDYRSRDPWVQKLLVKIRTNLYEFLLPYM
jgi:hypothetical protein